jgi:hypothetical protein
MENLNHILQHQIELSERYVAVNRNKRVITINKYNNPSFATMSQRALLNTYITTCYENCRCIYIYALTPSILVIAKNFWHRFNGSVRILNDSLHLVFYRVIIKEMMVYDMLFLRSS